MGGPQRDQRNGRAGKGERFYCIFYSQRPQDGRSARGVLRKICKNRGFTASPSGGRVTHKPLVAMPGQIWDAPSKDRQESSRIYLHSSNTIITDPIIYKEITD